jgi:hypothetical protein
MNSACLQYSLRSLLLLVLVAAVVTHVGVMVTEARDHARQAKCTDKLQNFSSGRRIRPE